MSMSSTIAEVTFYIIIYGKDGDGMAPTAFGTAMVEPIRGIRAVRDLCEERGLSTSPRALCLRGIALHTDSKSSKTIRSYIGRS